MAEPVTPEPATLANVYSEGGTPIDAEFVGNSIERGAARFDTAAEYSMLDPAGAPKFVKGGDVWNAIQQGWQVESAEGRAARIRQEQAGPGTAIGSAALGALEALTLGTAPGFAAAFGPEGTAKKWREVTEASPTAHTIGEVLGFATPMGVEAAAARGLTRGAAGAVAEGVTAAPRAVSRIARGAGELTTKALPEATTAFGKALQRGARMGVEGTVEGATYGAGYAVGESSLGDKELTAERLLAAAGTGALLGGGIGAGLGAGSVALGRAAQGIDVSGFAERQAWKATGATGALTRKVGLDQAKRSGRRMLDEGLLKFESFEERAAAIRKATNEAGSAIGKLIERIDDTGSRANVAPILERVDEQLGKLRDGVGADVRLANRLDRDFGDWLRARIDPDKAPTFKELHGMRARVDDYIGKAKAQGDTILLGEYGKLRGAIEDEIKRQADSMATRLGDDFLGEYTAAKSRYQDLVNAAKVAEYRAPMLEAGNRSFSLTDNIMAGAGLVAAGPQGLALAGANKLFREYGDTAAALFANKLSKRGASAAKVPTLAEVMGAAPSAANQSQYAPSLYQRLLTGDVPEADWKFLRDGYRDVSSGPLGKAYSGPASANDIATGRAIPPGSKEPIPPIQLIIDQGEVHLRDGRHRLAQAQANGATEIRATIQDAADYHAKGPLDLDPVVIAIPGRGGPSPDAIQAKLAALGYVKSKADKVAMQLSKDVSDAVTGTAHKVSVRGVAGPGAYEALAADAREHRIAPERSATKIAARVAPLVDSAPELARAVTVKATGDLDYLARQLPSAATSGAVLEQAKKIQPSGSERATFERKARAVVDPKTVVFDMKKGQLSEDAIAAIRERRPLLLSQIQAEAERAYAELVRKGQLPDRQNRLQLEKLLERKIDPASNPTVIRIVQRAYASQQQMQNAPPMTPSTTRRHERFTSQSEAIARGEQ